MARALLLVGWVWSAAAQMAGDTKVEMPPPVAIAHCTLQDGCKLEYTNATLDANWRWIHGVTCSGGGPYSPKQCYSSGNCYTNTEWDKTLCKDPKSCAQNCALEGVDAQQYDTTYGVTPIPGGVELKFVSGQNVGSRLYLTDSEDTYKLFKLKNREFSFDVDMSTLPCGVNGAVYFSEMEVTGGKGGLNKAGAKYGTGYCDAQCPHDVKFMNGLANILDWNTTTAFGRMGACCVEMDIWEANTQASAYTPHPCETNGTLICDGALCGGLPDDRGQRYKGVCDKDGCDFNSYRMGDHKFIGEGPEFKVDTSKVITVVTQWLTSDGTDEGPLSEIRRVYVQDNKIIENSKANILTGSDAKDDSVTDEFCSAQKKRFGDPDQFTEKGGLKTMGESFDRGMVLVLSLWDDYQAHMLWLDSLAGKGGRNRPGVLRGPCGNTTGVPQEVRAMSGSASVKYTNFMYGEIGSTLVAKAKPDEMQKADKKYKAMLARFSAPPLQPGQQQQQQQQQLQQQQQQQLQQQLLQQQQQQQLQQQGAVQQISSGADLEDDSSPFAPPPAQQTSQAAASGFGSDPLHASIADNAPTASAIAASGCPDGDPVHCAMYKSASACDDPDPVHCAAMRAFGVGPGAPRPAPEAVAAPRWAGGAALGVALVALAASAAVAARCSRGGGRRIGWALAEASEEDLELEGLRVR
ncbi:unnamed protein product [Prorocentrum cordatum]|uniref:cellulase n=1 Tax=Prorocentrum cordatum TaxID=2364126 RepID=A0ABN9XL37_9DINO|nr:unnamed protein product [Polarella glacialis]